MSARCAIPGCEYVSPGNNPICITHYFALPPKLARMIIRAGIERDRAHDEAARSAHAATLERYLQIAQNHLPKNTVSAPAEPDAWSETGYRRAVR
jgi:hypothetical protein